MRQLAVIPLVCKCSQGGSQSNRAGKASAERYMRINVANLLEYPFQHVDFFSPATPPCFCVRGSFEPAMSVPLIALFGVSDHVGYQLEPIASLGVIAV